MHSEARFLILKYGQDITITPGNGSKPINSKAIIQPLRSDYQSDLYGDYLETQSTEQFLCIGLPGLQISALPASAVITAKNQNYIIKKAENVYLSDTVIYERAVLEKS